MGATEAHRLPRVPRVRRPSAESLRLPPRRGPSVHHDGPDPGPGPGFGPGLGPGLGLGLGLGPGGGRRQATPPEPQLSDEERREALRRQRQPIHVIGRAMYETSGIPAEWAPKCNEWVDELWLPSEFNMRTFAAAGVGAARVRVRVRVS